MAMVVPDGGKTVDGGIRDSVRMAFRLPDGTVSYFYVDSDGDNGWARTDDKNPNNVFELVEIKTVLSASWVTITPAPNMYIKMAKRTSRSVRRSEKSIVLL